MMTCAGHALLAPNVADSSSDEEDEEEEDSPAADKRLVPVHSLLRADVIGLYFGAGRSKPSRKFERLLHKAYAKLAPGAGDAQGGKDGKEEAARRLEVVYVSHDHSSEEFKCASNAPIFVLRADSALNGWGWCFAGACGRCSRGCRCRGATSGRRHGCATPTRSPTPRPSSSSTATATASRSAA